MSSRFPPPQGTIDAFARIAREEGASGFFRGLAPSVQRAAVINGCGIASYDHSKHIVLRLTGQTDGLLAQVSNARGWGVIQCRRMHPRKGTPFNPS